jgi:pimeloyl-ACP methyl ester carboxylesterase
MRILFFVIGSIFIHFVSLASNVKNNFNVTLPSGDTLFGTLEMPISKKPNVVLIIAGSGPTDRDCNSTMGLQTNAFKMLADSLKNSGIASIRFDKRGIGDSKKAGGNEEQTRFNDMSNDVVLFLKKIKLSGMFSKIFIAGHSEGSLVGMIAANQEKIDGFISIAGPGEDAGKVLSKQIKANAPQLSAETEVILTSLRAGKTIEVKNEVLSSIFRKSVQPYLISWMAYDPQLEIKKLEIPVLIIQGSTDLQVSISDAQMLKNAQVTSRLVIIEQMNHPLKTVSINREENLATYNKPDLPIDSDFCQVLINFCK